MGLPWPVSELPVMGSPWAWLAMDGLGFVIYVYFFFQILVQIFFGFFFFFFFCLKVEQINFFFFNLMVFLIFDWGLGELVRNGWGGPAVECWEGLFFFFFID